MRRQVGFTLIEVMVVVAIVAILAAVAYPSYGDYVRRGKIAEAVATLADTRAKLEQFFLDNRSYLGADNANMPCNAAILSAGKKSFTYACALAAGTYTVTATGAGADGMTGFTYTIDNTNLRQTTAAPAGYAASTMPANCWLTKRGGTC